MHMSLHIEQPIHETSIDGIILLLEGLMAEEAEIEGHPICMHKSQPEHPSRTSNFFSQFNFLGYRTQGLFVITTLRFSDSMAFFKVLWVSL